MLPCDLCICQSEIPFQERHLSRAPGRIDGPVPGCYDSELCHHARVQLAGHVLRADRTRHIQRLRYVLIETVLYDAPKDLEEAAKIDGRSYFRIYWNIYLPLSKAALVSLAIFTILASWNDLLWPLIMTSSEEMRVLSIGISSFQGQHSTDYPR